MGLQAPAPALLRLEHLEHMQGTQSAYMMHHRKIVAAADAAVVIVVVIAIATVSVPVSAAVDVAVVEADVPVIVPEIWVVHEVAAVADSQQMNSTWVRSGQQISQIWHPWLSHRAGQLQLVLAARVSKKD